MSIRQKRTMTEKSLKAHRRNAPKSRGPVTGEGKKHSRDANLSHGFYDQDGGAALVALGEDPVEYQALASAVAEKWQPADAYEEQLGTQLVRALWRVRRSDRMQEGLALRLAQEAGRWRQDNLHARMTKLSINAGCLRSLAEAVGQPDFAATPSDLQMVRSFQADGVLKEMGAVILDLLIVLKEQPAPSPTFAPGSEEPEADEPEADEAAEPAPEIAGDEFRDSRVCLQNILRRQAELLDEQRVACLQEFLGGPSAFERAAEFSSSYNNMKLLQRVEDSNFRQVWRITDLFIKLKGGTPERNKPSQKTPLQDSDAPPARTAAVEAPEPAPQASPIEPQDSGAPPVPAALEHDPEPPAPFAAPQPAEPVESAEPADPAEPIENEGASGKVQSNQQAGPPTDVTEPSKSGNAGPDLTLAGSKSPGGG